MASLPNALSLFRVALIPLLVVLCRDGAPLPSALAAATFFVACLSDFFDGYLARRSGGGTTLGKFLDPLADKLLIMAALIMVVAIDRTPRVPAWMVVVIVGRDLAVTGLRSIASGAGVVLGADELGKYKTIFLIFALHGLLIHYRYLGIDFHVAGMYFLWIGLAVSLWSAVNYHLTVIRLVRERTREGGAAPGARASLS